MKCIGKLRLVNGFLVDHLMKKFQNTIGGCIMLYKFMEDVSEVEHDEFVKAHPLCNLLQSSNWAKVKDNWKHVMVGVKANDQLVASSLILIKPLPFSFTMLYIPRGPILDYENEELVKFYFSSLKKFAKKFHCLFVKFDPEIHLRDFPSSQRNTLINPNIEAIQHHLKLADAIHMGFTMSIKDTIQPRYQSNVYPCENFEESLPRHTRRLIKDALKRNVEVTINGADVVDEFSRLVSLTEERKGVHLRNKEYFYQLCEIYGDDAKIFLGQVNLEELYQSSMTKLEAIHIEMKECPQNSVKKLRRLEDIEKSLQKDVLEFKSIFEETGAHRGIQNIAGVLSIKFGNTCEMLYAGMDQRFKKFMPQYYIYQENMKWAFAKDCKNCNMGGVEGSLDDGLTKFKDNFNPLINELIGEFDLPVNKILYKVSQFAYKLRKRKLNK